MSISPVNGIENPASRSVEEIRRDVRKLQDELAGIEKAKNRRQIITTVKVVLIVAVLLAAIAAAFFIHPLFCLAPHCCVALAYLEESLSGADKIYKKERQIHFAMNERCEELYAKIDQDSEENARLRAQLAEAQQRLERINSVFADVNFPEEVVVN